MLAGIRFDKPTRNPKLLDGASALRRILVRQGRILYPQLDKTRHNVFGGQFLARGGEVSYREVEKLGDIDVIVEFPDRQSAIAWEEIEQYQAILPGRTDNTTGYVIITDGI